VERGSFHTQKQQIAVNDGGSMQNPVIKLLPISFKEQCSVTARNGEAQYVILNLIWPIDTMLSE